MVPWYVRKIHWYVNRLKYYVKKAQLPDRLPAELEFAYMYNGS